MKIVDTPCPACGQMALRIERRLRAMPIGTFSLSGEQMKVSAIEVPWLVCGSCGAAAEGTPACHPKTGWISGETYCGVHGRAAGWPCAVDAEEGAQ